VAVDPAGFFKVKYEYADGLGSIFPGMEGKLVGTPTDAQLQTLVNAMGGFWTDRLAAITAPAWLLNNLRMIYSDGTIEKQFVVTRAVIGTLGSTISIPRSACIVTGYHISSFYRGGKPRTYWPGPGKFDGGSHVHFDPTVVSNMAAGVALLISDVNAYTASGVTSVTLGCIRRHRLGSPIVPPEFFAYGATHCDTRICTQRKRLGQLA